MHRRSLCLCLLLLSVACSPVLPQEPRPARIEIHPGGVLLTGGGDGRALSAAVFDDRGRLMEDVAIVWNSSHPSVASVDAAGVVNAAAAVGSSQVVASVGSLRSAPVVVVVAELVPEAVLVSDAQILGEVTAVDDTQAFGPGFLYTVRLHGMAPPDIGSVLVASESATLVGRVLSVAGDVVTLEVIPLDEVVTAMELEDSLLDLSSAPMQFPPDVEQAFDIEVAADGSVTLSLKSGTTLSSGPLAAPSAFAGPQAVHEFQLGPFDCEAEGVLAIDLFKAKFTVQPNLSLEAAWNSSVRKLVVGGQPTVTYDLRPVLSAALEGKVDCKLTLAEPKIPLPGFLGFFLGGIIPIGIGFELGGSLPLPAVGVDVQGSISATISAGFVCPVGGGCSYPRTFEMGGSPPKVTPVVPEASPGLKLELSAYAYAFAGLEAGITSQTLIKTLSGTVTSFNSYRLKLLVAKGGLKLSAKLASELTQAQEQAYAADYGINFEASISAGKSIEAFFGLVKISGISLSFELANIPLASSPKLVGMSLDREQFEAGDLVHFTVDLDPQFLNFLGSNNIDAVRVYRLEAGTLVLANEINPTAGQQSVVVPWVATLDSTPGMRFVAFVKTNFFPAMRLKLGQVTVGAKPLVRGEIRVSWHHVREVDGTAKPHTTPYHVIHGGSSREVSTNETSAIIQVEMERIGDDLIFTILDQSSSASSAHHLDSAINLTYGSGCTSTDTDTADWLLTGSNSVPGHISYLGPEALNIWFSVLITGSSTRTWSYPCQIGAGSETQEWTQPLQSERQVFPVLIDPDFPETLVGSYSDTVVTPTLTEDEEYRIEITITETVELSWNLQTAP